MGSPWLLIAAVLASHQSRGVEATVLRRAITASVTCDNYMKFYADGILQGSNNDWTVTSHFSLPSHTQVLAIECVDVGVVGGILASFSDGKVTGATWKCANSYQRGWASTTFDDSAWSAAYEIGQNGMSPWGARPGILSNARWIWTSAGSWHGGHKHVYCRLTVPPPTITASVTCDNQMKFYADGILQGSNNDWTVTSHFSLPSDTQVLAIDCVDAGVVGGILASFSDGKVTGATWKCTNSYQRGWVGTTFDDSAWSAAYEIGQNGMRPWGARPGILSNARWIWTSARSWHGGHKHVYCRLTVPPPTITASVTCDNQMKFYADGILQGSNNHWTVTSHFSLPSDTQVLAIECVDLHVVGGILASFSDGKVTGRTWKCTNSYQSGWASTTFDDSAWSTAYEIGHNGMRPWGARPGILSNARWIWTSAGSWHGGHKHVYCRLTVPPAHPPAITASVTCDNQMKFYADGILQGSNNDWTVTSHFSLPSDTQVLAIECVDLHVVGGILASFSDGKVTGRTWKCTNSYQRGWASTTFDDSAWRAAYEIGQNGMRPWGARPGILSNARWIWTSAGSWHGGHKHVYCRLTVYGDDTLRPVVPVIPVRQKPKPSAERPLFPRGDLAQP